MKVTVRVIVEGFKHRAKNYFCAGVTPDFAFFLFYTFQTAADVAEESKATVKRKLRPQKC